MTRTYRMKARAEAARETERRILEAAFEAFFHEYYDLVTLGKIAAEAGVTDKTVLRKFGSKEELLSAVVMELGFRFRGPRGGASPGEYRQAIVESVEANEQMGREVLHVLAQEDRTPALRRATEMGRANHRAVTAEVFGPWLPAEDHPDYDRLLAPFVVILDVFTWRLLRLDQGLSREETERVLVEMVEGLLARPAYQRDQKEEDHA